MGQVLRMIDYRRQTPATWEQDACNGLIPVELGTAASDCSAALRIIEDYGIDDIQAHRIAGGSNSLVYLMWITDAIRLNKMILDQEELEDAEVARRIDLIQMLENADMSLLNRFWQSLLFSIQAESS